MAATGKKIFIAGKLEVAQRKQTVMSVIYWAAAGVYLHRVIRALGDG